MVTPQIKADNLAKKIGLNTNLYLKHEDMHPLGSHKGRSIPPMINKYVEQGITNFVISSSGNAALAAALHIKELNRLNFFSAHTLTIFVGEKIEKEKLQALEKLADPLSSRAERRISIIKTSNPKQQALQMEKNTSAKYLRQSTDDTALTGYESLAEELAMIENLSAVFIPTSSGTTAQGLYEGFKKLNINPQIHIIQTTACHPIVDTITTTSLAESRRAPPSSPASTRSSLGGFLTPSVATAIVDNIGHRKIQVAEAIKNSHGQGWIATNEEIKNAIKLLKETENTQASPNSALAVVGLIKSIQSGAKFTGPVVCILTGK